MVHTTLRSMVISSAMAALALTLPMAFHVVGLGSQFLPMLLPLLLNGFLVPLRWAAPTALIVPGISAVATGMPPLYPPIAAVLSLEGAVMAATANLLYAGARRGVWIALVPAVVAGRLASAAGTWGLAAAFGLPAMLSAGAQLAQGLPGVALQLAVVPLVLTALRRSHGPLFAGGFDE